MGSKETKNNKHTGGDESEEKFELDLEPSAKFLRTMLVKRREATRTFMAWLVTGTLCACVLVFLLLTALLPEKSEPVSDAFEKVCFVSSPLVGLALGTYYRRLSD